MGEDDVIDESPLARAANQLRIPLRERRKGAAAATEVAKSVADDDALAAPLTDCVDVGEDDAVCAADVVASPAASALDASRTNRRLPLVLRAPRNSEIAMSPNPIVIGSSSANRLSTSTPAR